MIFLGDSLKRNRKFPADARHDAGYQLDKVQRGRQPNDFRPMPVIGKGVEEMLHASQKKTQSMARRDLAVARKRLVELMEGAP